MNPGDSSLLNAYKGARVGVQAGIKHKYTGTCDCTGKSIITVGIRRNHQASCEALQM